jgi:hypothetical protein
MYLQHFLDFCILFADFVRLSEKKKNKIISETVALETQHVVRARCC